MGKKRVYELAKELNQSSKVIVEKAQNLGIDVKNHMGTLNREDENKLQQAFKNPVVQKPNQKPVNQKPNDKTQENTKNVTQQKNKNNRNYQDRGQGSGQVNQGQNKSSNQNNQNRKAEIKIVTTITIAENSTIITAIVLTKKGKKGNNKRQTNQLCHHVNSVNYQKF